MAYEHVWVALALVWVFGWLGGSLLAKHLREQKLMRLREMLHRERMAAMDKGMPVPEPGKELEVLLHGAAAAPRGKAGELAVLGAAIVLIFGGVGIMAGFQGLPDTTADTKELRAFSTLGVIPAMVGWGLLIFYGIVQWANRRAARA